MSCKKDEVLVSERMCEPAGEEGWKSATCVSIESMEERQPIYTEVGGGLAGMPS
jgi:hypothetical protein